MERCLPQEDRDALILPLIPRLVGTRGSATLENRRATMAAGWLVRVHTPAWLRLAGLITQADALAGLPEIIDFAVKPSLRGSLKAAQKDADAAWATAGAAAWDAARAKLEPTRLELQQSALALVERMISAEAA